jgi:L-ascorbate metabolism protein UlaG (beta-lactamase superfamily)
MQPLILALCYTGGRPMNATLQWFGTATWRLNVDDTVIWLDAYINRAPAAPPLPYRAEQVDRADAILVGHSHFDHIADAGLVAKNTGATVVGSALSCEIAQDEGVPAAKTVTCTGGEELEFGPVRVTTLPSLHGFNGLMEWPDPQGRDRKARIEAMQQSAPDLCEASLAHMRDVPEKQRNDGGPLAYILEWDGFRLFWHDTPGLVRDSWHAAAARGSIDLALLSAAAAFSTPNIDGEPVEAGAVAFVSDMAAMLEPRRVVMNHHDDWCPPITFHLDEELFRPSIEQAGAALEVVEAGGVLDLS